MLKHTERGAPAEGDRILGNLLRRGRWSTADSILLPLAYAHVRTYETPRIGEAASAAQRC